MAFLKKIKKKMNESSSFFYKKKEVIPKKKKLLKVNKCTNICKVVCTKTNTFVSLIVGRKLIYKSSSGHIGFLGPKKETKYAAEVLARKISQKCVLFRLKKVKLVVLGSKFSRRARGFIRSFGRTGVFIDKISFLRKQTHNGVRLRKRKRR